MCKLTDVLLITDGNTQLRIHTPEEGVSITFCEDGRTFVISTPTALKTVKGDKKDFVIIDKGTAKVLYTENINEKEKESDGEEEGCPMDPAIHYAAHIEPFTVD